MSNPLVAKGRPNRYLHIAVADALLAVFAACAWQGLFRLPMQEQIPAWVWPVAALLFTVSALRSYAGHRAVGRR